MSKPKQYAAAPLPFQGQKRNFLRDFREALDTFGSATTFVDLFGGSGLLAHTAKRHRPDARVIYNDYDDFRARLENYPRTNALLERFRPIVANIPRKAKMPPEIKARILEIVRKEEEETGFVDYITLSGSIVFSMNYVTSFEELSKQTLYNNVRRDNYDCSGYLDGLEVVREDYKAIFERFQDDPTVVFIVDPPYLSTDVGTYKNYWKLGDYLDVTLLLKGTSYIYFTSEKSHIVELCNWIQNNQITISPFAGATIREHFTPTSHSATYRDMMFYKKRG